MSRSDPNLENPQVLLRETLWLQQLARGLCDDRQLAEDLSQDAMLAAWQARGRILGPLRPWLAGVLRRLVANRRRLQARRGRRERVAATLNATDRTEVGTDEVVARAQWHESVVQSVLALKEPSRTVVLLRYFDELSCAEIAMRLQIPVETVRTRVKRGVAQLREQLDERHGGRAAWLTPLAAIGDLAAAPAVAVVGSGTLGWLMMLMNWKLVAAAAVVIGVGLLVTFDGPDSVVAEDDQASANASGAPTATGVAPGLPDSDTAEVAAAVGREVGGRTAVAALVTKVRGRIVFASNGQPAAGVEVVAHEINVDGEPDSEVARAFSSDDGGFEIELENERPFALSAAHPGFFAITSQTKRLRLGTELELGTIHMAAAVEVEGRVRDTAGRAVEGIDLVIALRDREADSDDWVPAVEQPVAVESGVNGAFRLEQPVREGRYWVTTRGSGVQFIKDSFEVTVARPFLDLVVERDLGTIRGVVVDASGQPAPGVEVASHDGLCSVAAASDGRFELRWRRGCGQEARLRVWRRRFRRAELLHESAVAYAWGETAARVELPELANVRLQVVQAPALQPVEVFDLDMQRNGGKAWVPNGVPTAAGASGERHKNGVVSLVGMVPGIYRVLVVLRDRSVIRQLEVFAGSRDAQLVLPAVTKLALTVSASSGGAVVGARCDLFLDPLTPAAHSVLPLRPGRAARGSSRGGTRGLPWPSRFGRLAGAVTDSAGAAKLSASLGSSLWVRVSAAGFAPYVEQLRLRDAEQTHQVVLERGAKIRGKVSPAEFVERLVEPFVCLRSRTSPELFYPAKYSTLPTRIGSLAKDGTFELSQIPAGDWVACLGYMAEGHSGARIYQLAPLPGSIALTNDEELEVALDAESVMPVSVVGVVLLDGVALPHARLQLTGEGFAGQSLWGALDADPNGRFEGALAPGTYEVSAHTTSKGTLRATAPIVVAAGRRVELAVTVEPQRQSGR